MDIGTISTSQKVDEIVDILADIIVDWNANMSYKNMPKDKKVEKNCQDFVEEILKEIKIEAKFQPPLSIFLEKLRKEGHSELIYETKNEEILKKFGIRPKTLFETHKDLDLFVKEMMKVDHEFQENYSNDYALLKSFDRAFWLRHYSAVSEDKYKCLKKEDEETGELQCDCPFGDPIETQSIQMLK